MKEAEHDPWVVRHLYTNMDRGFGPYLTKMHSSLDRAREAGWVEDAIRTPVSNVNDLAERIGESFVLDLHGHTSGGGAWVGSASDRRAPA